MNIRRTIITGAYIASATLGLTACSGGTPNISSTSTPDKGYIVAKEFDGEVWTYACDGDKGYIPVDVAVGELIQRDGSSYSLKEHKDNLGEQDSVTLTIRLAANQLVPAIIVDNEYHGENEAGGQALYQPQLQGGSSLKVTLATEGFGGSIPTAITRATACTKYLPTPSTTG